MVRTIMQITETRCVTGEGPMWHPDEAALYWCDIPNGRLFRHEPNADTYECVLDGERAIGGFTIQRDGALLLFRSGGRVEQFDGDERTTVATINAASDTRFNDVITDPEGRVFAGTMPTNEHLGRLYRFDTDGSVRIIGEGYDIPNGIGFTSDLDTMFVTESEAKTVYQFDYDRTTGKITNRRPFLDLSSEIGIPDGMTVDADGDIWSARWNGGMIVRYDEEGTERERVEFPAKKVSSVTFGGPDYGTVYVTTAGGDDRANEGDGAGALFTFCTSDGVRGRPEFRSSIPV